MGAAGGREVAGERSCGGGGRGGFNYRCSSGAGVGGEGLYIISVPFSGHFGFLSLFEFVCLLWSEACSARVTSLILLLLLLLLDFSNACRGQLDA